MKIGRNDQCPCGSGRKYKKCCLERDRAEASRQVEPDPVHELGYSLPGIEAAWPALADLADTTEIEEGPRVERDGAGRLVSVEFTWLPADPAPDDVDVDVGHVRIESNFLMAHTSTARALDSLRRALEARLPLEAHLSHQQSRPKETNPGDVSVTEAIDAFIAEHHRGWPDRPVPALDNRTPRQVCAEPGGPEQVATLLQAYEAAATPHQQTRLGPLLAALREELGLPGNEDFAEANPSSASTMPIQHAGVQTCLRAFPAGGQAEEPPSQLPESCANLLDDPEAARSLVDFVGRQTEDADESPAARLLERLMDFARMASEDGQPQGDRFVAAANEALDDLGGTASPEGLMALARAYTGAGLRPPDTLGRLGEGVAREAGAELADAEEAMAGLDDLLEEGISDPFGLYQSLQEALALQPPGNREAVVAALAGRAEPPGPRLAMYWLLDPDPRIRHAAAGGLVEATREGHMAPEAAGLLTRIRSWLPRDEASTLADQALAQAEGPGTALPPTGRLEGAQTLLPDGAGAQSLMLFATDSDGLQTVGMVLLKAGHGVKDAYEVPGLTEGELRGHLSELPEEGGLHPLSPATVGHLLGTAVAESRAAGKPPPPGLLDVFLAAGFPDRAPSHYGAQDWLGLLDPEAETARLTGQMRGRLINRSIDWPERHPILTTWFLATPEAQTLLASVAARGQREAGLRDLLEFRREPWATQILQTGLILKEADPEVDWREFAAVGASLLEGRELRRIPIMNRIIDATIEAFEAGGLDPATPKQGAPGEAAGDEFVMSFNEDVVVAFEDSPEDGHQATLENWSATAVGRVDGFLTAVLSAPKETRPEAWLPELMSGLGEPSDEDEAERMVEAVIERFEAWRRPPDPFDPESSPDRPTLPEDPVARRAWLQGFRQAVTSDLTGWPSHGGKGEDGKMILLIADLAEDKPVPANADKLVRQWLAARLSGNRR